MTFNVYTDEVLDKIQSANFTAPRGYYSGIKALDKIIRIDKRQLTIVSGKAENGKTTFLDYFIYMLAKNANVKTLFISFEGENDRHVGYILQYAEREIVKEKIMTVATEDINTVEQIVEAIRIAKETYNVDNVVVDPFNYIVTQKTDTNVICHMLKTLKQAAKKYDVSVILVAHPRNLSKDEEVSGETISGSIHFRNVADIIIIINTNFTSRQTTVKVDKVRDNEIQGEIGGTATFVYNSNRTYSELATDDVDFLYQSNEVAKQVANRVTKQSDNVTLNTQTNVSNTQLNNVKKQTTIDYDTIMQTKVSYLTNVMSKQSTTVTLQEAIQMGEKYKQQQEAVINAQSKEEKQRLKRDTIPAFTPSVIFNGSGTTKNDISVQNRIMCIDIDGSDNNYITTNEMKHIVSNIPFVFYAQNSVSSRGIYALIQIADVTKHEEHFTALEALFKRHGLTIDSQCKDINRKRFVSYDSNPYINRNAIVFSDTLKKEASVIVSVAKTETTLKPKKKYPHGWARYTDKQKAEYIAEECVKGNILLTKNHQDSLKLCSVFKSIYGDDTEKGFEIVKQLRKQRPYCDEAKLAETYAKCKTATNPMPILGAMYRDA